jgi:hypothetical protein
MVMFSGGGEAGRMPSHAAHRAPQHTPHPLITKNHPAHAPHAKAARHSAHKARTRKRGTGTHHRATVVAAGNPATVRLHNSDATALWPLAQHVNVNSLTVGGAVVGIVFDPSDPGDALLTGVY